MCVCAVFQCLTKLKSFWFDVFLRIPLAEFKVFNKCCYLSFHIVLLSSITQSLMIEILQLVKQDVWLQWRIIYQWFLLLNHDSIILSTVIVRFPSLLQSELIYIYRHHFKDYIGPQFDYNPKIFREISMLWTKKKIGKKPAPQASTNTTIQWVCVFAVSNSSIFINCINLKSF